MNRAHILEEKTMSGDGTFRRWALLGSGASLAVVGATRKSWGGAALAGAGGLLIYSGLRSSTAPEDVEIARAVTINKAPNELFTFWRNLENLPRFMEHLESVEQRDGVSHWVVRGPLKKKVEWDATISHEAPNEMIRWHSLPGGSLDHSGWVQFKPAPGNRGTVMRVYLRYSPPRGTALSTILGKNPEQVLREELRHFKQMMETGEIPTTEGQPAGKRGKKGKGMELLLGETSRQQQETEPQDLRRIRA